MDFDKFKITDFERRTATVKMPALTAFADEGKDVCEIEVQALTGEEVARARERVKQNAGLAEIIEKFAGGSLPDLVEAMKEKLGMTESVTADAVYRIAVLEFGIVGHPLPQDQCVKLFNHAPEAFYDLTNKILELTGLGSVPAGEPSASGEIQESAAH